MCEIQSQNNGDIRIVCVEKRTGKLNIFFQQKWTGKRTTHSCSMCAVIFGLPSPDPHYIYIYIFCVMLFSI